MTHGTVSSYTNNRCRCEPCTVAMRAYQTAWRNKNRERARAAGRRYKAKNRERAKRWRSANRERVRANERKRQYGLTDIHYRSMLVAQGDRCAICRQPAKLHVDHDHQTGKVRGLLCRNCNIALGLLNDDTGRIAAAARYLGRLR